jgi:predicted aspartyl protease
LDKRIEEHFFRDIRRTPDGIEGHVMSALSPVEQVSRRRFVGCGAAAFGGFSGLAHAQSIASPPKGAPPDEASRIAAQNDSSRHLTIEVMIGGRGPFRFVVDTGADRSVIAEDVANSLGLARGTPVTVQGVVRSVNTQTVLVSDLKFGDVRHGRIMMPTLPHVSLQADGYLGLDAIDGRRVTLDFRDHELLIGPSHRQLWSGLSAPREAIIPVSGSDGHLRSVNCRVDGVSTAAFIDTGAAVSVGNSRLFNALVEQQPGYAMYGTTTLSGVTGGQIEGQLTEVHRIKLNAITFTDAVIVISDLQIFDIWGLADKPALLIGMNFMREFARVSIDYGRKEILLDLASLMLARQV